MEIRCPACKKMNVQENICLRCGTDLSALKAVRSAAYRYLEKSRKHILAENAEKALICARYAWMLEHTPKAAEQAFLACLLLRRYDQATNWYALISKF